MMQPAKNDPVLLHSPQDSSEKREKPVWERQKGERAEWYMRFRLYLTLGPKRSLQAAVLLDRQSQQAPDGTENHEKPRKTTSVPGSWKQASIQWHWVTRAQAWDLFRFDERMKDWEQLATNAPYANAAYRIHLLDKLAHHVEMQMSNPTATRHTPRDHERWVARLQLIIRDIGREAERFQKRPFEKE